MCSHNSMYDDEEFVHPAPKLVSADLSIKNIFPKNLSRGYDSDASSIRSGYSLGGGQLDDSDLEIYLMTNDIKSNNGSEDDRPRSCEAFVKNAKKLACFVLESVFLPCLLYISSSDVTYPSLS
jgi:hypothetical protein